MSVMLAMVLCVASDLTVPSRGALRRVAPIALIVAVGARFLWIIAGRHTAEFVDLRVYYEAARRVSSGGGLYDFVITQYTPQQPLPFTYPPFASLVLFPLRFLPFPVAAAVWVVVTILLLFLVVWLCLAIVAGGRAGATRLGDVPIEYPMLWTAVALWLDPVRTNLDYGQINVVLMLLGVGAAYLVSRAYGSSRAWGTRPSGTDVGAGALIGLAAGIKLTPAVGGLFLLARRRIWAALFSALAFGCTIAASYLVLPAETRRYFTVLLGDTGPIGYPAKPDNQSLRGVLSRYAGHDIKTGLLWLAGVLVATVLIAAAWWFVRQFDALIALVLVQWLGLMVSPISWIHHFVWVIPLLIWVIHGPLGRWGGWRGGRFAGPGEVYTRWSTVLFGVVMVYAAIGVTFSAKGLRAIGIHDGLAWAIPLTQGPLMICGLVVLILTQRRRLQAVV